MVLTESDTGTKMVSDLDNAFDGERCFQRISNTIEAHKTTRPPTFHASEQGPWCAVICYDACVRLCLNSWAKGCGDEAPFFLENECAVLRKAFGIQNVLLQSEEELLAKQTSELVTDEVASIPKKTYGKVKVEVRKIKIGAEHPPGCNFSNVNLPVVKFEPFRHKVYSVSSSLRSGWNSARRVRLTPHVPPDATLLKLSTAYMQASAEYIKIFSRVFKSGMTSGNKTLSSCDAVQESYFCLLRLKSEPENVVRLQPASGESHVFFPCNHTDDIIIEVQNSRGQYLGRVLVQVATIYDDTCDKLRWWAMYHEPEQEVVGRLQLNINCFNTQDENIYRKFGRIAETLAYDVVLEVAMKMQDFHQRNLTLHGQWKWLVDEFSSYYGVSDVYSKLRYLTYVMDVATPTKDCVDIVCELLPPLIMKRSSRTLSHQESRMLGEINDQVLQILSVIFENYKSLDETSMSGMIDVSFGGTRLAAPVLVHAVKLYSLLHDVSSSDAQLKLCKYFQAAARKTLKRYVGDTDEVTSISSAMQNNSEFVVCSYKKMTSLVLNITHEIHTDIQIMNQHVLPNFLDLPNLCAPIYGVDLSTRLQSFLAAFPPSGPTLAVVELLIATADFEINISSWNINVGKGGVHTKDLFHPYIMLWIQQKRISLLEVCKGEKVRRSGITGQDVAIPIVDDMYKQLKETLNEYEVIICRWPEYAVDLEMAIADVEKAVIEALDRQYADVLAPLNEIVAPKIFGLKYVQKFSMRSGDLYFVPDELGILLNSMKKMIDVQHPEIEGHLKMWTSANPSRLKGAAGEYWSEITTMLRSKFRNYLQAVSVKLMENTKLQDATKLKKIIEDPKESTESNVGERMQPLINLLQMTFNRLQPVAQPFVFIAICRGLWDKMGEEILRVLQVKKENRTWYKSSRIALSILDDLFASELQKLLDHSIQDKNLEPPRSILELRSVLCEDSVDNYYC